MKVRFLKDYGLLSEDRGESDDLYGLPLYEKGEIAYVVDDFGQEMIADGFAERIKSCTDI